MCYAPGDPAPDGYLAWHEWADVQIKAGLKQYACGRCVKWKFPQELSGETDSHTLQSKKGSVLIVTPVCLDCVMNLLHTNK